MTSWAIETLSATTVLMLVVLILREPVARRFGATAAYLLWLAPACRMLLPPLPAAWLGARDEAVGTVITMVGNSTAASAVPVEVTNWPLLVLILWLGGVGLFLCWHYVSYARFVARARQSADWLYAEDNIQIASSPAISSPIAFGIFGKAVMLPADFAHRFDPVEQRLALAHEVAHHRRHDLPANLAALVMLSLHWFNPVAHWAHRAFRIDQEAACDAQILRGATAEERHAYGTALFKSVAAGTPLAACAMGAATTIKARISRIVAGGNVAAAPKTLGSIAASIGAMVLLTASTGIVATSAEIGSEAAPTLILGGGILTPVAAANIPGTPIVPKRNRVTSSVPAAPETQAAPPSVGVAAAPEPPAPPSLGIAAVPPVPPVPPAALVIRARHIGCADGMRSQFLSGITAIDGQNRSEVRIVVCKSAPSGRASRSVREAITSARDEIAGDKVIGAAMRDRLVAALDRQIAEAERRQADIDPIPHYSLQ